MCMFACSKIDAELNAQDRCVLDISRAAGVNDVLNVGLHKEGAVRVDAIGQFDNLLVILTVERTWQLSHLLRALKIAAEIAGRYTEFDRVPQAALEHSARGKPGGKKQGKGLDVRFRRDGDRPKNAEPAVAARSAKRDKHLIEHCVQAPASVSRGTGRETGKFTRVVPAAKLV